MYEKDGEVQIDLDAVSKFLGWTLPATSSTTDGTVRFSLRS